jgi:hypothetical protein
VSLQYKCDYCGEVVEPPDAYGLGVFTNDTERAGRAKVWEGFARPEKKLGLSITPFIDGNPDSQICGACVGQGLKSMIGELWPPMPDIFKPETWSPQHFKSSPESFEESLEGFLERKADATHSPGSDRADSDMPGVRAESDVPESSSVPHPYDDDIECICPERGCTARVHRIR